MQGERSNKVEDSLDMYANATRIVWMEAIKWFK